MYTEILKKAKINKVKSYKNLYGTKENMFAKVHQGQPDCSWYCKIKDDGKIIINTKYYSYPGSVINYNKLL